MVFGWGKKKQETKQEPETPSRKEVEISEIPKILSDFSEVRTKQLVAEVSKMRDKTNPLIKELSRIIRELEKDDLQVDDIDKHLRVIVVRGKKQVIEIVKKDSIELEKVSTYNEVVKLSTTLSQMLKKIGDVLGRQTRVIHIFAKKYAEKLKMILEEMNQTNSEINAMIKNYDASKSYSESVLENLEKIKEIDNTLKTNSKKIQELEDAKKNLNEKIQSTKQALLTLKESREYQEYQILKKSLVEIQNEKNKIKTEVDSHFTKISRPLSRYEYVSSLEKEQKFLLSQLTNEPLSALLPNNKDSIITILENIRKGISTGSISVKDTDKTMSYLTEVEESLDSLIAKLHGFHYQRKELENKLESSKPKDLENLERLLISQEKERDESESKIRLLSREIEEENKQLPDLFDKVETNLRSCTNTLYILKK